MVICFGLGITILTPPFRRAWKMWGQSTHNKPWVDAIFVLFIIEFIIVLVAILCLIITSSVMLTTCGALLPLFGIDPKKVCNAW